MKQLEGTLLSETGNNYAVSVGVFGVVPWWTAIYSG